MDFQGKRVGAIGTGCTGVQVIPAIAQEADHLTVFQRTPQYSTPAQNHPLDQEYVCQTKDNYSAIKRQMRESFMGTPNMPRDRSALDDTPEERQRVFEEAWEQGHKLPL